MQTDQKSNHIANFKGIEQQQQLLHFPDLTIILDLKATDSAFFFIREANGISLNKLSVPIPNFRINSSRYIPIFLQENAFKGCNFNRHVSYLVAVAKQFYRNNSEIRVLALICYHLYLFESRFSLSSNIQIRFLSSFFEDILPTKLFVFERHFHRRQRILNMTSLMSQK